MPKGCDTCRRSKVDRLIRREISIVQPVPHTRVRDWGSQAITGIAGASAVGLSHLIDWSPTSSPEVNGFIAGAIASSIVLVSVWIPVGVPTPLTTLAFVTSLWVRRLEGDLNRDADMEVTRFVDQPSIEEISRLVYQQLRFYEFTRLNDSERHVLDAGWPGTQLHSPLQWEVAGSSG